MYGSPWPTFSAEHIRSSIPRSKELAKLSLTANGVFRPRLVINVGIKHPQSQT